MKKIAAPPPGKGPARGPPPKGANNILDQKHISK